MGLISRKKSNSIFGGSKLNVPGQGIYTVQNFKTDKISFGSDKETPNRRPTPTPSAKPPQTPSPTPSVTPTMTPTVTPTITPSPTPVCLLAQENLFNILTEDLNFILVDCPPSPSPTSTPNLTSTPTMTPTNTETPTPTPTITETPTQTPTPTMTPTQTFIGVDPASLSPILYYQTFDTNYLVPSTPNTGDGITQLYKYSDSGQTATGVTSCVASYENLNGYNMLYFPGGSGGCWPPPCTGTCSTSYTATDDINFMHQSGYSFTMYIVARPSSGSTTGGTGIIFSNIGITTPLVGEEVYIDSNFDVKLLTRFPTGGPGSQTLLDLPIEINGDLNTLESKSLRIFSIIASDTFDTVTTAATSYVNGIEVTGVTQSNVNPNVLSSSTSLKIGDGRLISPFSDPYGGHLAEIIIFNSAHNITTHNNIILFLKNRWGIT